MAGGDTGGEGGGGASASGSDGLASDEGRRPGALLPEGNFVRALPVLRCREINSIGGDDPTAVIGANANEDRTGLQIWSASLVRGKPDACPHTHARAYGRTCAQTRIYPLTQTHTHTHIRTSAYACTHTRIQARTRAHTHARTQAHVDINTLSRQTSTHTRKTYIRPRARARARARASTHTHAHTPNLNHPHSPPSQNRSSPAGSRTISLPTSAAAPPSN
jgi:hypothetical protein